MYNIDNFFQKNIFPKNYSIIYKKMEIKNKEDIDYYINELMMDWHKYKVNMVRECAFNSVSVYHQIKYNFTNKIYVKVGSIAYTDNIDVKMSHVWNVIIINNKSYIIDITRKYILFLMSSKNLYTNSVLDFGLDYDEVKKGYYRDIIYYENVSGITIEYDPIKKINNVIKCNLLEKTLDLMKQYKEKMRLN